MKKINEKVKLIINLAKTNSVFVKRFEVCFFIVLFAYV